MKKEKILSLPGIKACPVDGNIPELRMTSGKRFRIVCPVCQHTTELTTKVGAVLQWYALCDRITDALKLTRI